MSTIVIVLKFKRIVFLLLASIKQHSVIQSLMIIPETNPYKISYHICFLSRAPKHGLEETYQNEIYPV